MRNAVDTAAAEAPLPVATPVDEAPQELLVDQKQLDRWLRLLHSSGPALFKLWSLELADEPARLPEILQQLMADHNALARATESAYQRALVLVLDAPPAEQPVVTVVTRG